MDELANKIPPDGEMKTSDLRDVMTSIRDGLLAYNMAIVATATERRISGAPVTTEQGGKAAWGRSKPSPRLPVYPNTASITRSSATPSATHSQQMIAFDDSDDEGPTQQPSVADGTSSGPPRSAPPGSTTTQDRSSTSVVVFDDSEDEDRLYRKDCY